MIVRTALSVLALASLSAPVVHAEPPNALYTLVDTAALRLQTAEPVAAFKWINGGPITDPARAQQVLDTVAAEAVALRIDPAYVRTAFRNQIDATEGVEYARFGQWKFDPDAAPRTAPELTASRSAIDGYNTTMVETIAQQWDSLHAPGCTADLDAARQTVIDGRSLDPLYAAALQSATRSYCATT